MNYNDLTSFCEPGVSEKVRVCNRSGSGLLRKYGLLPPPPPGSSGLDDAERVPQAAFTDAIKEFQHLAALPETGLPLNKSIILIASDQPCKRMFVLSFATKKHYQRRRV